MLIFKHNNQAVAHSSLGHLRFYPHSSLSASLNASLPSVYLFIQAHIICLLRGRQNSRCHEGRGRTLPSCSFSLPERREMVTKGKSKVCGKRDGNRWQGEKYSQDEEREGDGEQHVTEGGMVRRPGRVEQGNSALFGGSTFYFIFYFFLKCGCSTMLG